MDDKPKCWTALNNLTIIEDFFSSSKDYSTDTTGATGSALDEYESFTIANADEADERSAGTGIVFFSGSIDILDEYFSHSRLLAVEALREDRECDQRLGLQNVNITWR